MIGMPRGIEWIVILVIAVLIFGVGRLGQIGKELGTAIRGFREGLAGEKDEKKPEDEAQKKEPPAGQA